MFVMSAQEIEISIGISRVNLYPFLRDRESNQQRYRGDLYSHIKEFSSSLDIKVEDPPRNLTSRRMHLRERPLSHNFPTP